MICTECKKEVVGVKNLCNDVKTGETRVVCGECLNDLRNGKKE